LDIIVPNFVPIIFTIFWVVNLALGIGSLVGGVINVTRRTLSPRARHAAEIELRELALIRDGEDLDAAALDELLLNMKHRQGRQFLTEGFCCILIGGLGPAVLLFSGTRGVPQWVNLWPILAPLFVGASIGANVGTVVADIRYAAAAGTVPETRTEEMFEGTGAIMRRPRWLFTLNYSLVGAVCVATIIYSLNLLEPGADPTTPTLALLHPWFVWIIPVALCLMILMQELVIRYELRRPSLRLTRQPDLARRADMHLRREAYKRAWEPTLFPMPYLAVGQLLIFVVRPVAFPLIIFALVVWTVNAFYNMRKQDRQTSVDIRTGTVRSPQ
jgi:TRAP-type C4-dicarboxylate transport system permease small subunit